MYFWRVLKNSIKVAENQFIDYYEVTIQASNTEMVEIYLAWLQEYDVFESFIEQPDTLLAYMPANLYQESIIQQIMTYLPESPAYSSRLIPRENWNISWEQNYPAVEISSFCFIHPEFIAPNKDFQHNICIQPKMSFGTGHHATTQLVIKLLQQFNCSQKRVSDVGCGTGILGILASKLGATSVSFVDIDHWCIENTQENIACNHIVNTKVQLGTAQILSSEPPFDLILANITRNILLDEAPLYLSLLKPSASLMLSGFYKADIPVIVDKYQSLGFTFISEVTDNEWAALRFHYYHDK